MIVALLIGFALAQPLSGSALAGIVHRVEAKEGAPAWPETGFVTDALRSLESMVVSYGFGLPILALLFLVNVVFPPAAVVTFPLKIAVIAILFAWDLCDYPLSIRGWPIAARVAFMKRNAAAMIGFGVGLGAPLAGPALRPRARPPGRGRGRGEAHGGHRARRSRGRRGRRRR
jgi:CysZ protein